MKRRIRTKHLFTIAIISVAMLLPIVSGMLLVAPSDPLPATGTIATSQTPQSSYPGKLTNVQRTVNIDEYGTFSVVDEFRLVNDGGHTIQEFLYCLNQTNANELSTMVATEKSGARYAISRKSINLNGFVVYSILLNNPVLPGDEVQFTVRTYFKDKVTLEYTNNTFYMSFYHSLFPLTPYPADSMKSEVRPPVGSTVNLYLPLTGEKGINVIYFSVQNAAPFTTQLLYVNVNNSNTRFIENEISAKDITLGYGGFEWFVSNNMVIENKGPVSLNTLTLTVPGNARNFSAKDAIGDIGGISHPAFDNEDEVPKRMNVTINLLENRYTIDTGAKLEFTFSYKMPAEDTLFMGDGQYLLLLDIYELCTPPWAEKQVTVTVSLPQAINLVHLSDTPDMVDNEAGTQRITYSEEYLAPGISRKIIVSYAYSGIALQGRAFLIALVAGIILTLAIITRKLAFKYTGPATTRVTVDLPVEELTEFTTIYDKRVMLYLNIEQLNDDFKRRKVKKREFSVKIEELSKRLKGLEKDIAVSKRRLIEFGGRFKEIIENLDVLEAERQAVQDSILVLERRYKEGKIKSRIAFEKLYDNYSLRLKKIKVSIDSGVNELKSFVL